MSDEPTDGELRVVNYIVGEAESGQPIFNHRLEQYYSGEWRAVRVYHEGSGANLSEVPEGRKPLPDEWFSERAQMQERIEELEAEVDRLRLLVPSPDQTQDEIGVWAEATAAAYGAAADIAHEGALATEDDGVAAWVRDRIKAQTPQSARDWLAERDRDIRDAAFQAVWKFVGERLAGLPHSQVTPNARREIEAAIKAAESRALPIKEKDDE